MTKIEFAKGMAFLSASIGKEISRETIDAWFAILGDLDPQAFHRAIVAVVRGHKFSGLPPAGLIRQAAGASGGVIDADAAALLAWQTVIRAMREIGGYRSVLWKDKFIGPTIEAIGESWAALCKKPSTELHTWTKKAFVEAYKANVAAGIQDDGVSAGIIAQDAGRIGFQEPEPVQLGDVLAASYGFGGSSVPAIEGPTANEPRRLTAPLAFTFGNLPDIEAEEAAAETAAQNAAAERKNASRNALEAWTRRRDAAGVEVPA